MKRIVLVVSVIGCGHTNAAAPTAAPALKAIDLPGAPKDGVLMDYLAYDREHHRVWVPAGNTGSVDVIDVPGGAVTRIEGFPTQEMERRGKKRVVGPSSATVAGNTVYVGNRGDSSVCAVDAISLKKAGCVTLDSMPDGLAFVAATHEVWVTTPRDKSIRILDVSSADAPKLAGQMSFEGEPEGYAVDDQRGIFYTNLEDKDRTLAIDIKSRQITQTWLPACGEDGPKGLALDTELDYLFVACSDHVEVLDAGHEGRQLSRVDTGAGVDNIDYVPKRHELYAAAARAAKLTVARVDTKGMLQAVFVVPTASGARNAVATDDGAAYLTDSPEGKLLVVAPEK